MFSDITGMDMAVSETYSYIYESDVGSVELRIVGGSAADDTGIYATLMYTFRNIIMYKKYCS